MTPEIRKYMVELALKLQGTPYIWGGSSPHTGLDCSGFVVWIAQVFGVLPSGDWGSATLAEIWPKTFSPEPGDLAFYGKDGRVSHVMMHITPDLVVGASGGDSTTLTPKPGACVKVKNLRYRSDYLYSTGITLYGNTTA